MKNPEVYLLLCDAGLRGRLVTVETAVEDGRVCVLFEGAARPILPLTEPVEIELQGTSRGAAVRGSARVLQHRIGSGATFYVLELPQPCRVALAGLYERRSSERVSPTAVAPLDASLSLLDGGRARAVVIKDLSKDGAGLLVQPPEELGLLERASMRLAFALPGEEEPLELAVHLTSRRPVGPGLLYGVAFDTPATQEHANARERIREWVAVRAAKSALRAAV